MFLSSTPGRLPYPWLQICSRKMARVECRICRNSFANEKGLRIHTKNVHDNLRNYECPICTKKFNLSQTLKQHIKRTHESHNKEPCECQLCGAKLKTKSTLKNHTIVVHEKNEKFECGICRKSFDC